MTRCPIGCRTPCGENEACHFRGCTDAAHLVEQDVARREAAEYLRRAAEYGVENALLYRQNVRDKRLGLETARVVWKGLTPKQQEACELLGRGHSLTLRPGIGTYIALGTMAERRGFPVFCWGDTLARLVGLRIGAVESPERERVMPTERAVFILRTGKGVLA